MYVRIQNPICLPSNATYFNLFRANDSLDEERSERDSRMLDKTDGMYRFYNVLWIERKGDIAYRRAAGRVPKAIWEANCTGPTKIILG